MITTVKNFIKQRVLKQSIAEISSVEAYDLWSKSYDAQPGNLMLDLDEYLFPKLLSTEIIKHKAVADIGCGTGRHWQRILDKHPFSLTGFDVSEGMLKKLSEKFPNAHTYKIIDDLFLDVRDATFNTIVSTLTIAHIPNIEVALKAWCRILKPNADIIITDFHPSLLAYGGKRTFKHNNTSLAVQNFVHSLSSMKNILGENGFIVINEEEIKIDETLAHYYINQNALAVYEQFKGFPAIYGIHLRRNNGTK